MILESIKEAVADNEKLAHELLKHLERAEKAKKGLEHAAPIVLANESDANTRKMLNTTMNLVREQQDLNRLLISVVLMLCGSRDFTGWQAELAVRLGSDPGAVLRKMWNDKLQGK